MPAVPFGAGLFAVLIVLPCTVAKADSAAASELLIRAADAIRTSNYQGIVIYRDEDHLDAIRVVHRFGAGHERERLSSLNGEVREIFREDDQVSAILPKDLSYSSPRLVMKGFVRQLTPDRLRELSQWYEFQDRGSARVAAQDCVGAAVIAKDRFRYSFEIWVDRASGVPIKLSLLNGDNEIIEQVMFTEIEFPASIPDAAFDTVVNISKFQLVTGVDPAQPLPLEPIAGGAPDWVFSGLPPGFRVVMHDERSPTPRSGPMEHLLLTDGLSSISVFAAPRTGQAGFEGLSHMGSVHAYGRSLGDFHITVVGEAPMQTIRAIGDGISRVAAPVNGLGASVPARELEIAKPVPPSRL